MSVIFMNLKQYFNYLVPNITQTRIMMTGFIDDLTADNDEDHDT